MALLYLKAVHIIFVTTWFAGLFYLVRLFIYHLEADEEAPDAADILKRQYAVMQSRLLHIITTPSMVLTVLTGTTLMVGYGFYTQGWMWVKVALVVGLLAYHFSCIRIMRHLKAGTLKYSARQMRLWNEVATLFLVAIVFLVELKSTLSLLYGVGGLVVLAGFLMLGVRAYRKYRERNPQA